GEGNQRFGLGRGARGPLELVQVRVCVVVVAAAHLAVRAEADTDGRTRGLAEEAAAVVGGELHAADARRLALGNAGDGRRDGRGDATGGAADAAAHVGVHV